MSWIKNRIDVEYKKYGKVKELDWSKIAEAKIQSQIKSIIDEIDIEKYTGGYCFKANSLKRDIRKVILKGEQHE